MVRALVLVLATLLSACGAGDGDDDDDDGPQADAPAADAPAVDGSAPDGGAVDGAAVDARSADAPALDAVSALDAVPPPPDAPSPPDAPPPPAPDASTWVTDHHVDVHIDNFCNVTVVPPEITVPAGEVAQIDWHNNSVDYAADLWASYGGGFIELPTGAIWDETFTWCSGSYPYTGEMDIGPYGVPDSVCPHHYFLFHCL